jgi:hypothetical protein
MNDARSEHVRKRLLLENQIRHAATAVMSAAEATERLAGTDPQTLLHSCSFLKQTVDLVTIKAALLRKLIETEQNGQE